MEAVGLDPAQLTRSLEEWRSALNSSPVAASDSLPALDEAAGSGSVAPAFAQVLNGFLSKVDEVQHRSDAMVESLALGEPVDVHQVMLALGEASNALQLTLQVRGKLLEAYQELMRLQI
jgi:flagellar hook-basal body complex protein FliE